MGSSVLLVLLLSMTFTLSQGAAPAGRPQSNFTTSAITTVRRTTAVEGLSEENLCLYWRIYWATPDIDHRRICLFFGRWIVINGVTVPCNIWTMFRTVTQADYRRRCFRNETITTELPDVIQQILKMNDQQLREVFKAANQNLMQNPLEQNARSFLGNSTGNEFLTTQDVIESAQHSIEDAKLIVKRLGFPTVNLTKEQFQAIANLFDPEGELIALSKRSVRQASPCIYALANSQDCSPGSFREPTGRCTSLFVKTWGMAGTPYRRILFPRYEDGISQHRTTEFFTHAPLKSARVISTQVTTTNVFLNSDGVSAHTMQWGQFIAHEFTLIGEIQENVACCPGVLVSGYAGGGGRTRPLTDTEFDFFMDSIKRTQGDVCIPVVNRNDPVFGGNACIHQTRSKIAPTHNCSPGPRQQMNMITHFIDGSAVYGSSLSEANALRTLSGGLLKSQIKNGASLPPCSSAGSTCPFLGGDKRINATPNLIAYHTMFLNVHNKIATQLKAINPTWLDEELYQETRRIVAALEANIHFYEYLPTVLSHKIIKKYRLGTYDGFDPSMNPSVLNELAGAAMRFGHSTINGIFTLIKDNLISESVDLTPTFFDPSRIHSEGIKQCVRGLTQDLPWITDRNFPTQMRDKLFNKINDIVSLNINRGRDHGFASYLDYRRYYGLFVPTSWADLSTTHPPDVVAALRSVYTTVEDIELYIGGVTENVAFGGLVGDTFGNILGEGFSRNRKGDRLFFESKESGLTAAQVASIKQYTLSNLLCDGSDINKVSSEGFFRIGQNEAVEILCASLPKLNLSLWKQQGSG